MNIKTLSTHYIYVPLTNPITGDVCNNYTAKLFIWHGLKAARPAEPAYEITKVNAAAGNGSDPINVSHIVNDFIDFSCAPQTSTTLVNGLNQAWVKFECYYDDNSSTPFIETVYLAVKGYGLFLEGENPQLPNNKILLRGDEFKVNRGGRFVLPLMALEPVVAPRVLTLTNVEMTNDVQYQYEYDVTANFPYASLFAEVRAVGSTDWQPLLLFSSIDPNKIILPEEIIFGEFETRVSAFDTVTLTRIYSNVLTEQPYEKIIHITSTSVTGGGFSPKTLKLWFEVNYNRGILKLQFSINSGAWFTLTPTVTSPTSVTVSGDSGTVIQYRVADTTYIVYSELTTIIL